MKTAARVFWMLVWLGGLAVAGAIILTITASRVGEHKSSTYGRAYAEFQSSWGGEIGIVPPEFSLQRTWSVREYNSVSKEYEIVQKTEQIPLIPRSIGIRSTVDYGEQSIGLLKFNAFEVSNTDAYVVANKTGYTGELMLNLTTPENANLLHDFTVNVAGDGGAVLRPVMGRSFVALSEWPAGAEAEITVTYATKGMDTLKYNLSAYQSHVVESLEALLSINTRSFAIYRFGLPHQTDVTPEGASVRFEVKDFSTSQDLGITFDSKQMYLDQIQSLMAYSPLSLLLYILAIFIYTQIHAVRFNALHYIFIAAINVFYFLFVSYLIRFFGVGLSFAISTVLTAAMFLAYCPSVLGWRFASRVAAGYLFALTVVFSLIFLMPIFRGILFVALVFLVFMSIMIPVGRSDISKWDIARQEPE